MDTELISQVEKELFFEEPQETTVTTLFDFMPFINNYLYLDENNRVNIMSETDKKMSFRREVTGKKVVVILEDGTKGQSKCSPEDDFDLKRGTDIAFYRAMIKHQSKFLRKLTK